MNLSIQYLRGIASIMVVFAHFYAFPVIQYFCGAIGVDVFFIISGYIMSQTAENYDTNRLLFIKNRFIRVFPLYLIISLPVFIAYIITNNDSITVLKSVFFIGGDYNQYKDPLLFSGWSLFFEVVFYLIISFRPSNKMFISIILGVMGLTGLLFKFDNIFGYLFNSFYLYFLVGYNLDRLQFLTKHFTNIKYLILSVILLLLVMLFRDNGYIDSSYIPRQFILVKDNLTFFQIGHSFAIPRVLFWGIPVVFFVVCFMNYFKSKPEIKLLKKLGDISYSMYLVHTLLSVFYSAMYEHHFMSSRILYFICFLSIFPLSLLTYNLVEVRLTNYLKKVQTGIFKAQFKQV